MLSNRDAEFWSIIWASYDPKRIEILSSFALFIESLHETGV